MLRSSLVECQRLSRMELQISRILTATVMGFGMVMKSTTVQIRLIRKVTWLVRVVAKVVAKVAAKVAAKVVALN